MSKKAERQKELDLREICARCRETFGRHGATPPHTLGDGCPGFIYSNRHKGGEK